MAGRVRPPPAPITTVAGRMSTGYLPSTGIRESSSKPIATRPTPATSTGRPPQRTIARGVSNSEKIPMTTVIGRNARPVAAAPNPSTTCRYRASRNWNANNAPTSRNWTRFALHTRRSAKTVNGSNGCRASRSRMRKPTSSRTLPMPETIVNTNSSPAPAIP